MSTDTGASRISGIVLAGGQSRRLGRDKAVEPVGAQPLILRVIERIALVAAEIIVVVADANRGQALPLADWHRLVVDRYPGGGSLGGIFSGLAAAQHQWAITVACDMPFLNRDLIRHMLSRREGVDAVVPLLEGRPEPTHALYSKRCLPFIERRLLSGDLKIAGFFDEVRVSYLSAQEITPLDPDCLSFFNVNTPVDLDKALALAAQGR